MKACNICQGKDFSWWGKKGMCVIVRCSNCGLIFADLDDNISITDKYSLYGKTYFDGTGEINFEEEEKLFSSRFCDRLKRLENHVRKGKLLDVGCANGTFLSVAREHGWDAAGYEISEYAASKAKDRGFRVYAGLDDSDLRAATYDLVTMWHVLEHITNPRFILTKVHELLKPSGMVVIEVPDVGSKPAIQQKENWHFVKPPEHLYYFDKNTLSKLLELTGFSVLESVQLPWGTGMADKVQNIGFGIGAKIKATLRIIPGMAKLRDWMIRNLAEPEVLLMIASKSR